MADDLQEGYEGGLGFEVRAGYGLGAGLVLCGALVYQSYHSQVIRLLYHTVIHDVCLCITAYDATGYD